MYKPLVSIMIPFHNAEATLSRCLDSVVGLTYRPLEIIMVDDAGKDRGSEIARNYQETYSSEDMQFVILTQQANKGVAVARNMALNASHGEYITAIDADDYIEPEAISEYVRATDAGKVDIVAAGVFYEYEDHSTPMLFKEDESLSLDEVCIDSLHFLLTNKLIRTSMLRSVSAFVPGQNCWEDLGAVARLLALGATTKILRRAWYHYVQFTSGSLTKSDPDRILHQHIDVACSLEQWLTERSLAERYASFLIYLKFIAKVKYLRNYSQIRRRPLHRLRLWRDTFPEVNPHIMSLRKVSLHHRLLFRLAFLGSRLIP